MGAELFASISPRLPTHSQTLMELPSKMQATRTVRILKISYYRQTETAMLIIKAKSIGSVVVAIVTL